jgi:hypothetical protein
VITGGLLDVAGFHRVLVVVIVLLVLSAGVSLVGLPRGVAAGRDPASPDRLDVRDGSGVRPPDVEGDSAEKGPASA